MAFPCLYYCGMRGPHSSHRSPPVVWVICAHLILHKLDRFFELGLHPSDRRVRASSDHADKSLDGRYGQRRLRAELPREVIRHELHALVHCATSSGGSRGHVLAVFLGEECSRERGHIKGFYMTIGFFYRVWCF